jgi:DNA-binding transcriptional LysR family regulator
VEPAAARPNQIIDCRKLIAFVALARCANFSKAALELSMTQSAISHAIKSLEDDLGCRLFDRLGRKAQLTQSGQHLLGFATRILAEMQLARVNLMAMNRTKWLHQCDCAAAFVKVG